MGLRNRELEVMHKEKESSLEEDWLLERERGPGEGTRRDLRKWHQERPKR